MTEEFDVVIIGAGAAGAAAAIYAGRQELKTLLLDGKGFGGQLMLTDVIENYPGFVSIRGPELAMKFQEQVKKYNVDIRTEEVKEINAETKKITTSNGKYSTKAIIIATGAEHRHLDVPGEKKFSGRGVSYCAVCDGYFFKGKKVVVIGGGNTALQYALYMDNLAEKVYLVHRRQEYRAEKILIDMLKKSNVEQVLDSVCTEVLGDEKVTGIKVKNLKTSEEKRLGVEGVFVSIGLIPNSKIASDIGASVDDRGYINVDEKMQTSISGIFAAGDVTSGSLKQLSTAVGQGAIAATSAAEYIKSISQ